MCTVIFINAPFTLLHLFFIVVSQPCHLYEFSHAPVLRITEPSFHSHSLPSRVCDSFVYFPLSSFRYSNLYHLFLICLTLFLASFTLSLRPFSAMQFYCMSLEFMCESVGSHTFFASAYLILSAAGCELDLSFAPTPFPVFQFVPLNKSTIALVSLHHWCRFLHQDMT